MTTQATADLLSEVQALIREREREGVVGLAELIGPAEWADLVPQLEPSEVAVLIQWLPDEEIAMILEELPPSEAARILRSLSLLGLQAEARALFDHLQNLYESKLFPISAETFRYWSDAVG